MGKTEQSGFDFDFVASAKHKSFEALVVFDIPKDRLHITGTFLSVFDAFFAE